MKNARKQLTVLDNNFSIDTASMISLLKFSSMQVLNLVLATSRFLVILSHPNSSPRRLAYLWLLLDLRLVMKKDKICGPSTSPSTICPTTEPTFGLRKKKKFIGGGVGIQFYCKT